MLMVHFFLKLMWKCNKESGGQSGVIDPEWPGIGRRFPACSNLFWGKASQKRCSLYLAKTSACDGSKRTCHTEVDIYQPLQPPLERLSNRDGQFLKVSVGGGMGCRYKNYFGASLKIC